MLSYTPAPLRALIIKHRELLRFAIVGGVCWLLTNVLWFGLKTTILNGKAVVALAIATIVATIVSYILNREWSFSTRGGREFHHEAALFFLISGVGVFLNLVPEFLARNVFNLQVPAVSLVVQEMSDFLFGSILGTLVAMAFRWWAFKKFVFPHEAARPARSNRVAKLRVVSNEDSDKQQVA